MTLDTTDYQALLSALPGGFCVIEMLFDKEGRPNDYRFLMVNSAFEEQTGLRDAVGKRIREIAPDNEQYWYELYGKVAVTGETLRFENEVAALHRWYEVSAYRIGGQDSRKVGIIFNDVSAHKQSKAALLESKLLIEGIVNAMPIRVFWKNRDLVYLGCNLSFANDAGFADAGDIVGKDDFQMGWKDQAELYRADDRQVIESGLAKHLIEEPQTTPDGKTIVLLTSKIPLHDSKGAIIGVLGAYQDITEHKQSQAALGTVQQIESLGTLAGGIAHDFNNILTAIMGNISLLKSRTVKDSEAQELVAEAENACTTAKTLSNQLLTFSKGGSPVTVSMDLRGVLTQAATFAARGLSSRCIFDLGESPLIANIDKDQITRVIHNLIVNADEAMPRGGEIVLRAEVVALEESLSPRRAAGRFVRLTVSDEGSGIDPSHQAKIFDPYFSTKGAGRGLGLATAYSIMAKHGGSIAAERKPGKGAAFALHFPLSAAVPAEKPRPAQAPGTGMGKVLIMDDEAPLAKVLKRMIEHLGYRAEIVADGQAALDTYAAALKSGAPYDAVILDLTVKAGMGGAEALIKLKALDPKVKSIISSGYSNNPIMAGYAAGGFSAALAKPYTIEMISEVLSWVIALRK